MREHFEVPVKTDIQEGAFHLERKRSEPKILLITAMVSVVSSEAASMATNTTTPIWVEAIQI